MTDAINLGRQCSWDDGLPDGQLQDVQGWMCKDRCARIDVQGWMCKDGCARIEAEQGHDRDIEG